MSQATGSLPVTDLPLLLVLLGPTGSGKTALSLALAQRFGGEVVSCDSVAVYRDFEIGTAKPTFAERRQVPHHLIDCISPERIYSAGDYSRDARAAIVEITGRGHLPIVTGGSGLYLRALLRGLFAGPPRSEHVRERLQRSASRHGPGWLHRVLSRIDSAAAAQVHPRDTPKLIRAIEVTLSAGEPITRAWKRGAEALSGYRILRLGLQPDRALLYQSINARAAAMFADGLVAETAALLARYGPELKLFDALGYRQAHAHLRGELTSTEAIAAAQQGHRNYAKRQMTWFRREPEVHVLPGFGDAPEIVLMAEALVSAADCPQLSAPASSV